MTRKFILFFLAVIFLGSLIFVSFFNFLWAAETCKDSDAGRYYYEKGNVQLCDESGQCGDYIYDTCDGNRITEYYCEAGQSRTESYVCPNECQDNRCIYGQKCRNDNDCQTGQFCEFPACGVDLGNCVDVPKTCSKTYDPSCGCDGKTYTNSCLRQKAKIDLKQAGRCEVSCTDSDESKNYYTKGKVDGYSNTGKHIASEDKCLKNNVLREYYCESGKFANYADYECPQSCKSGACQIVDNRPVLGCTDKKAKNYNSKANKDDGSCTYKSTKASTKTKAKDSASQEKTADETTTEDSITNQIKRLGYQTSEKEKEFVTSEVKLLQTPDEDLIDRLSGRILLQVENQGQAWYLDPSTLKRFYLKDGSSAYLALNAFGLGVTNEDLKKIPIGVKAEIKGLDTDGDGLADTLEEVLGTKIKEIDSDGDGYSDGQEVGNNYDPLSRLAGKVDVDYDLIDRVAGKILLQVKSAGEAWYINPADGKRYYLKDGDQAYQIMKFLSLGVSNENIRKIRIGEFK